MSFTATVRFAETTRTVGRTHVRRAPAHGGRRPERGAAKARRMALASVQKALRERSAGRIPVRGSPFAGRPSAEVARRWDRGLWNLYPSALRFAPYRIHRRVLSWGRAADLLDDAHDAPPRHGVFPQSALRLQERSLCRAWAICSSASGRAERGCGGLYPPPPCFRRRAFASATPAAESVPLRRTQVARQQRGRNWTPGVPLCRSQVARPAELHSRAGEQSPLTPCCAPMIATELYSRAERSPLRPFRLSAAFARVCGALLGMPLLFAFQSALYLRARSILRRWGA